MWHALLSVLGVLLMRKKAADFATKVCLTILKRTEQRGSAPEYTVSAFHLGVQIIQSPEDCGPLWKPVHYARVPFGWRLEGLPEGRMWKGPESTKNVNPRPWPSTFSKWKVSASLWKEQVLCRKKRSLWACYAWPCCWPSGCYTHHRVNSGYASCGWKLRRSCSVNRKKPQRGQSPRYPVAWGTVESRTEVYWQ